MSNQLKPHQRMSALTYDALVFQRAIYVAARLGLADRMRDGARTSAELAAATFVDADALERLLHVLAAVGVVSRDSARGFSLTELGSTLRSDLSGSMLGWVLFTGAPWYLDAWRDLATSIETGLAAWTALNGAPLFDYLAANRDAADTFDAAMTSLSVWEERAIADAYDFGRFRTVVDVGGGRGTLLITLLERFPGLRGVVFDQPATAEAAGAAFASSRVASRAEAVGGDFFSAVPAGADLYVLKYVVHDWDDEHAQRILSVCRRSMDPGTTLLLAETVLGGADESMYARLQDLEMLVLLGSRERTEAEYHALLRAAGFAWRATHATREAIALIEATAEPPVGVSGDPGQ